MPHFEIQNYSKFRVERLKGRGEGLFEVQIGEEHTDGGALCLRTGRGELPAYFYKNES